MGDVGELIRNYWPLVAGVGSLAGIGTFAWLSNRFVTKAEHRKLEERMAAAEKAIASVPSSDDWHEMDKRLVQVATQNESIMVSLKGIENRLAMLYENELRQEQK
ncbi:DUF2730 family protein [Photobacterium atrarenae]|uniref:DUF2730 domain-containing protein n=1 Tax=Photobacterium atrarenae TaxID=865757 RepID=A0ABY5GPF5_9GAMM|nr:DUF2730 family protein [Photobacterium atrarenae]UTV30178.1 DUF2730 domain-containing protein [Photobacterium atrarenae]